MNSAEKNILAIHDLSCFGRCALTVIIPTLSSMSHQVTPLPSALLSTHTGGFTNMVFTDLTDKMKDSFDHMVESGAEFDAVYSGFLGNAGQAEIVKYIIEKNPDALIMVDPVMGDGGELYQTYTEEMKEAMCSLCYLADVITPNLTEANFLLGETSFDISFDSRADAFKTAEDILSRLYKKYKTAHIALTGIEFYERIGEKSFPHTNIADNTESRTPSPNFKAYEKTDREKFAKYICTAALSDGILSFNVNEFKGSEAGYPGTGDIFASVLLGKMLGGVSFSECAEAASAFVRDAVCDTAAHKTPVRNGVLLERNLYRLTEKR